MATALSPPTVFLETIPAVGIVLPRPRRALYRAIVAARVARRPLSALEAQAVAAIGTSTLSAHAIARALGKRWASEMLYACLAMLCADHILERVDDGFRRIAPPTNLWPEVSNG
jgi:hypothetical protein